MSGSKFLGLSGDACRSFAEVHQGEHHSLLRAAVLEEGLFAHAGDVITREPGSLSDMVGKVCELEPGSL